LIIKEKSANESVKLVKKDYLPSFSGAINYGLGGQGFPLDNGWSFGANATIPVFNGYLTKNQVNEAKSNVEVSKSNIEILKQTVYLQVKQAYLNITESEKRIPLVQLMVDQAGQNLELANGRYNIGVGNSIELNDAEINYNNAQLSYIQALYDYNLAKSSLEKAMGGK
jgi:outer membrane protein TolC